VAGQLLRLVPIGGQDSKTTRSHPFSVNQLLTAGVRAWSALGCLADRPPAGLRVAPERSGKACMSLQRSAHWICLGKSLRFGKEKFLNHLISMF